MKGTIQTFINTSNKLTGFDSHPGYPDRLRYFALVTTNKRVFGADVITFSSTDFLVEDSEGCPNEGEESNFV